MLVIWWMAKQLLVSHGEFGSTETVSQSVALYIKSAFVFLFVSSLTWILSDTWVIFGLAAKWSHSACNVQKTLGHRCAIGTQTLRSLIHKVIHKVFIDSSTGRAVVVNNTQDYVTPQILLSRSPLVKMILFYPSVNWLSNFMFFYGT
jgi:hypothetical protein